MASSLHEEFLKLKNKVLEKRPVLKEIMAKRGDKNLFDYAKEYISVNLNNPIRFRQEELIGTFKEEVAERLGKEASEGAAAQLENHYFVSTADHHGPLLHPFFINGNLAAAAPYFEMKDPLLKYVIVLPCANVSLNNSSYPRGLIFHSCKNGKITFHRIPFFPANMRLCPVYNFRPYTKEDIKRARQLLWAEVTGNNLPHEEAEKVSKIIDEIYDRPEIYACESYCDQITKTNFKIWKKFFGQFGETSPDLVCIEQETFVAKLLVKYHLDTDTTITHILFDDACDQLMEQHFENIQGAFSRKEKYGTYLFWALPKGSKYRIQLWKKGNKLVSEDESYEIELTPENLKRALSEKELIPSMMMTFMVLSFYYGLKCLGGFSQVNYLTLMKNAYIKMQTERGNYRSVEVCARAQTKEIGGDFTIAFLEGPKGEMLPATGIDIVLYGNEKTWPTLVEESKTIGLEEAINPIMPEFYSIIYTEVQRDPSLSKITSADIAALTNLDKKIKACCKIKDHQSIIRPANSFTTFQHEKNINSSDGHSLLTGIDDKLRTGQHRSR